MTLSWETIINQYLEGKALRVEVESLRMRLDLDDEARNEIEAVLRLTDELAAAGKSLPTKPAGAEDRLMARLNEQLNTEAGHLDNSVADRLARQIHGDLPATRQAPRFPDVLAATLDEGKPIDPKADAGRKSDPDKDHP